MVTIEIKHDLGTKVRIKELECDGTVTGIWIIPRGIQYMTRYFINSKLEEVYFFSYELEDVS